MSVAHEISSSEEVSLLLRWHDLASVACVSPLPAPVRDNPRHSLRVPALGSLLVFSPSGVFAVTGADFWTDSLFFPTSVQRLPPRHAPQACAVSLLADDTQHLSLGSIVIPTFSRFTCRLYSHCKFCVKYVFCKYFLRLRLVFAFLIMLFEE